MRASRVRLLLSDVDGTLVTNDKRLTDAAVSACRDLRRAGVAFALTSSRPPRGLEMFIEPLALEAPLAGFNGGVLIRPDLSVLNTLALDGDLARETGAVLEELGLDVWVYTARDWFVPGPKAAHVEREAWILKFEPKILPDWRDAPLDETIKMVGVSDDPARMRRAEEAVGAHVGARASATRSAAHFLDVTHPEANKGAVVLELSRRLQIPTEEIAVIGDMPNDVLMFEQAGLSFAMGNAADAVKSRATRTTASNEDEGFAKAVAALLDGREA